MSSRYNPRVTVDAIIEKDDRIALVKRGQEPYKDMWALPGGHADKEDETTRDTARREAREETGLEVEVEYLLSDNTDLVNDPRSDFVNFAYLCSTDEEELEADTDAKDARWFEKEEIPEKLAFGHEKVLERYYSS